MSTFELKSTNLRVTDPCYEKDTWCTGVLENVLPGIWQAEKTVAPDSVTRWGDRIAELSIWHSDYIGKVEAYELTNIDVGVDSGQAGFFDDSEYPEGERTGEFGNLETFYGKVCNGTQGEITTTSVPAFNESVIEEFIKQMSKNSELDQAKIDELIGALRNSKRTETSCDYLGIANVGFGVATSSGYGDGSYNCYVGRNSEGQIVAARIVFIEQNEEEEENYEEDEDIE